MWVLDGGKEGQEENCQSSTGRAEEETKKGERCSVWVLDGGKEGQEENCQSSTGRAEKETKKGGGEEGKNNNISQFFLE